MVKSVFVSQHLLPVPDLGGSNACILTRLTNSGIVYLKGREISFQKSFPDTVEKQHKH